MVGGIVAEYNPFHNGHLYHIEKTKERCDKVIVALSGDVCQRGEFAAISKYSRAKAAVLAGADLVIEIPAVSVLSGAQNFSKAAVCLLETLGADILSFGSEKGDKEYLKEALDRLSEAEDNGEIAKAQKSGKSYPRIIGEIIGEIGPNDTLALEYLKAKKDSTDFIAIKREAVEHDDKKRSGAFASASYIREKGIKVSEELIPNFAFDLFKNEPEFNKALCEEVMLSHLKRLSVSEIEDCPAVSEGLENRIYEALRKTESIEEALNLIKTKRYTHARLRRILMCLYLGIKKEDIIELPYIRVLALNEKGAEILKRAKKSSSIPIVTSLSEAKKISSIAEKEAFATDMRRFFCGERGNFGEDFRYSPKILTDFKKSNKIK